MTEQKPEQTPCPICPICRIESPQRAFPGAGEADLCHPCILELRDYATHCFSPVEPDAGVPGDRRGGGYLSRRRNALITPDAPEHLVFLDLAMRVPESAGTFSIDASARERAMLPVGSQLENDDRSTVWVITEMGKSSSITVSRFRTRWWTGTPQDGESVSVVLDSTGQKLQAIRGIRSLLVCPLADAKRLAESPPQTLLTKLSSGEAREVAVNFAHLTGIVLRLV